MDLQLCTWLSPRPTLTSRSTTSPTARDSTPCAHVPAALPTRVSLTDGPTSELATALTLDATNPAQLKWAASPVSFADS